MSVNGDSKEVVKKSDRQVGLKRSVKGQHSEIRSGFAVGTPSVSKDQIVEAVRKVMKEDGMI